MLTVASFTVAENWNNLNVHEQVGGHVSGSQPEVVLLSMGNM